MKKKTCQKVNHFDAILACAKKWKVVLLIFNIIHHSCQFDYFLILTQLYVNDVSANELLHQNNNKHESGMFRHRQRLLTYTLTHNIAVIVRQHNAHVQSSCLSTCILCARSAQICRSPDTPISRRVYGNNYYYNYCF